MRGCRRSSANVGIPSPSPFGLAPAAGSRPEPSPRKRGEEDAQNVKGLEMITADLNGMIELSASGDNYDLERTTQVTITASPLP